jgi:hypothetical protein
VGLSEEEAKAQNLDYKTGKFAFMANSRARAVGDSEGMVSSFFVTFLLRFCFRFHRVVLWFAWSAVEPTTSNKDGECKVRRGC